MGHEAEGNSVMADHAEETMTGAGKQAEGMLGMVTQPALFVGEPCEWHFWSWPVLLQQIVWQAWREKRVEPGQ